MSQNATENFIFLNCDRELLGRWLEECHRKRMILDSCVAMYYLFLYLCFDVSR